tara:strand:- start:281 stop:514 length:234 start_codon:yes stop_codon:yes gene_type:complete
MLLALELWIRRVPIAEILKRCCISMRTFTKIRIQYEFPNRQRAISEMKDPSPEEIAKACRKIRSKWSEQEHRRRSRK